MATLQSLDELIYTIRDRRVMLDFDLAGLYGVTTKAFNQAVKRNADRFPHDLMFQVVREELTILRSQSVTSRSHGGTRYQPYAFTEHGVLMAATVLNSPRAIAVSLALVRAFVRIREALVLNQGLALRLGEVEKTLVGHEAALEDLYRQIEPLLLPPPLPPAKKLGF